MASAHGPKYRASKYGGIGRNRETAAVREHPRTAPQVRRHSGVRASDGIHGALSGLRVERIAIQEYPDGVAHAPAPPGPRSPAGHVAGTGVLQVSIHRIYSPAEAPGRYFDTAP